MLSSDWRAYPEKKGATVGSVSTVGKSFLGDGKMLNLLDFFEGDFSVAAHRNQEAETIQWLMQQKVKRGATIFTWHKTMLLPTACRFRTRAGGLEITLSRLFPIPPQAAYVNSSPLNQGSVWHLFLFASGPTLKLIVPFLWPQKMVRTMKKLFPGAICCFVYGPLWSKDNK